MTVDKTLVYRSIAVLALALAVGFFATRGPKPQAEITSFEECVKAGYPVSESYPSVCRVPDGKNFTEPFSPLPVERMPVKTIATKYGEFTLSFQNRVATLEGKLSRANPCVNWQTKVSGTKDVYASLVQFTVFNENKADEQICIQITASPQQIYTQAAANSQTIYTVIVDDEQVFFGKLGVDF